MNLVRVCRGRCGPGNDDFEGLVVQGFCAVGGRQARTDSAKGVRNRAVQLDGILTGCSDLPSIGNPINKPAARSESISF